MTPLNDIIPFNDLIIFEGVHTYSTLPYPTQYLVISKGLWGNFYVINKIYFWGYMGYTITPINLPRPNIYLINFKEFWDTFPIINPQLLLSQGDYHYTVIPNELLKGSGISQVGHYYGLNSQFKNHQFYWDSYIYGNYLFKYNDLFII